LPRVLLSLALIFLYNRKLAALTCLIVVLGSGIFCLVKYMQERYRASVEQGIQSFVQGIIPISSRILIGFTALLTFFSGIALIVRDEI
jgi:uncharacterized membrane protein HdeD (DUF308 family)